MRARISQIALIGTERTFRFGPGLNIITGPITSGKTSLLRLCRGLFGGGLDDLPPEVRQHVSAIGGQVSLGDTDYSVVRPNVTTTTAKVDVAGEGEAYRLPVSQLDDTASITYNQWLLGKLGLPRLEVPSAPTKVESTPTPVSINDYFLYCDLPQDEVDNSVFGHRHHFKNVKRKYVFEILYGIYNVEMAALQEELRDVYIQLRLLRGQSKAFERFLSDTPWANRATLEQSLAGARESLTVLEARMNRLADAAPRPESGSGQALRQQLQVVELTLSDLTTKRDRDISSLAQLRRLLGQLRTQTERLTRSIVADLYLVNFDFIVCPRCGAAVEGSRAGVDQCYLCLQTPVSRLTRDELIGEQDRIGAQILETNELIANREKEIATLASEYRAVEAQRNAIGRELDFHLQSYVSDTAAAIARIATERAKLQSDIHRLQDYLSLYAKLDTVAGDLAELEQRQSQIEAELERQSLRKVDAESRIRTWRAGSRGSSRLSECPDSQRKDALR